MSEIDQLGSSLLNRQRATRKRTEKRLRRDTRNQAVLNLAAKGVQLVNSALKNRADTFVNNNEDLIGQKVLYQQALNDRNSIITNYSAAQQHAGGVEEYLTEQFLPDITNSLNLNVDENLYTSDSIEKLARQKARKAAQEYMPQFETAYKAALNLPDMEDYDAFVATQTRGKKATNVGGYLVNSVLRNINEQSPEDTDQEIVDAVLNSRFGDNATAVINAKKAMDQGYSLKKAAMLSASVEESLTKETIKTQSITEIDKTIMAFGDERTITLQKTTSIRPDGAIVESTTANFEIDPTTGKHKLDQKGNKILSPQAAKDYLYLKAYQNGQPSPTNVNLSPEQIQNLSTQIDWQQEDNPRAVERGVFKTKGLEVNIIARNFWGDIVDIQTSKFVPSENLSTSEQLARIPQELVDKAAGEINSNLANFTTDVTMFGGRQTGLSKEMLAVALTGDAGILEDVTEADRDGVLNVMLEPMYRQFAVNAEKLQEELNIDTELTYKLLGASVVESIQSGMDEKYEEFREDRNFLNTKDFNNSLMLIGDSRIQSQRPGAALQIPVEAYNEMVVNAINEVAFIPNDNLQFNKQNARSLLAASNEFANHTINISYNNDLIEALKSTHNMDEIVSPTGDVRAIHILEHFNRLEEGLTGDNKVGTETTDVEVESDVSPNLSVLEDYERPPERSFRIQRQLDDAAQFQGSQDDEILGERVVGATEEQIRSNQKRNAEAAKEIKLMLRENKLPPKTLGLARVKINLALQSGILTDDEREVLNAWLAEESPK